MKTCQNVKCENIGTRIRCIIDVGGKDEIHMQILYKKTRGYRKWDVRDYA